MITSLLAGMTILVVGDSHLANPDYLTKTLHDDLQKRGAVVYSYGACGMAAGQWVKSTKITSPPPCGTATRLNNKPVAFNPGPNTGTTAYSDMVQRHSPNLVVFVLGDTMAGYREPSLPKTWAWQQVTALTKAVKASNIECVWVGPGWGTDGGKFGKTNQRVVEMSQMLSETVSPCTYINSLELTKKGELKTFDGQHYDAAGYKKWGAIIAKAIDTPEVAGKVKK
jgi:hypothetical protein